MKKLFIKICKFLGFEIIDQNNFSSPTLNKELNEDLSILNKKSIILPLGEVKITRKVNSILIIVRMNTDIEIWDQNKKRLFEKPKIEYSIRSIRSLINSINFCKKKYPNLIIKTLVLDDHSNDENLGRFLLTGGGRKNNFLLDKITEELTNKKIRLENIDSYEFNGDFIESQAFGYLAIRSFLKLPISFPETTNCKNPSTGGILNKNF